MRINKNYDDIINLPHHISNKHKQMSIEERSAQFAPFAALTGYDDAVSETARITENKIEKDSDYNEILDIKLNILNKRKNKKTIVTCTYFVPDLKKNGGKYETITGIVSKLDYYKKTIILDNNIIIPVIDIFEINIIN